MLNSEIRHCEERYALVEMIARHESTMEAISTYGKGDEESIREFAKRDVELKKLQQQLNDMQLELQSNTSKKESNSVLQSWVNSLTYMQQSVLLAAVRGPDGIAKYHSCKSMIRWYRRCILISAFDKKVLVNPGDQGGGSFTGPSLLQPIEPWEPALDAVVDAFMMARDELPYHYTVHFMHAAEVLGYKHPDMRIRGWWNVIYRRMVDAFHLYPETEEQMDLRLGDDKEQWLYRSDEAGSCSE